MGNTNNIIEICSTCNAPFTQYMEQYLSITINNKDYNIHQHGENIAILRFNKKPICRYKMININNVPKSITYPLSQRRGLILREEEYNLMCIKVYVSENALKFFILKNAIYYFPQEIIRIVMWFWKDLYFSDPSKK